MYLGSRHLAFEFVRRRDTDLMDLIDEIDERHFGIVQLLVEVTGKQNGCIFQFAFAALDRMIAEITDHHRGAARNGRNQQNAANDEPQNRIAPARHYAVRQSAVVDGLSSADRFFSGRQHRFFTLPALTGYRWSVERALGRSVIKALMSETNPLAAGPVGPPGCGSSGFLNRPSR